MLAEVLKAWGWRVGTSNPIPSPPLLSCARQRGGSSYFFLQETEAHGEKEVGEEDAEEAAWLHG
jgi:hypothetical protein